MIDNPLKKGLGKGLSSLLGDSTKVKDTSKISINDIVRNRFQPRKNFNQEELDFIINYDIKYRMGKELNN